MPTKGVSQAACPKGLIAYQPTMPAQGSIASLPTRAVGPCSLHVYTKVSDNSHAHKRVLLIACALGSRCLNTSEMRPGKTRKQRHIVERLHVLVLVAPRVSAQVKCVHMRKSFVQSVLARYVSRVARLSRSILWCAGHSMHQLKGDMRAL